MDEKRAAAIAGVMYYLQQEADEREDESVRLGMRSRSSGWSAQGRKAVTRGRHMVQGHRIRHPFIGQKTTGKSLQWSKRQHFRLWMKQHELL